MYSPRKADTLLVNIGNAVCVRLRRLSDLPVSIFCSLPVLSATLSYAMRTSSLTVFVLIVLTFELHAQIPSTWTDRLSGHSVTQAAEGFNFTARRNGKVTATATWGEIPHGSKFVLANTGG